MKTLQIDEKYISGLKTINHTVEDALKDFLLLNLSEKISEFKSECDTYENKYGTDFDSFEKGILVKINKEDFEEDDDYLAWKFAKEQRFFLQKKLSEIE